MSPRVYVTRRLPDAVLDKISQHAAVDFYQRDDVPVPRAELLQAVKGADGILSMLTDKMDAEVFAAAGPQLKVVANMAVGYDNITVEDAQRAGVMVTNTPDVLTETTADLVFALLLATARRIPEAERTLREGQWKTWSPFFLTGLDVYGTTMGLIGLGRIAEAVARRARGFGMRVVYHSRSRHPDVEAKYGCEYLPFDELLATADYVVPMTPLTEETRGLIGARELGLMKPTSVLINASRGPVVDEGALYRALKERTIWGAGLDVFSVEPIAMDHPLLTLDNAVLLPHIGSATVQTRLKMADLAAENLIRGMTGQVPPNRVV